MGTAWRKIVWGCFEILALVAMHGCQRDGDKVSLLDTLTSGMCGLSDGSRTSELT